MHAYIILISTIILDRASTQSLNHLIGTHSCQHERNTDDYLKELKEEMRLLMKDDGTKPGFLQTFTKFPNKLLNGMDLWFKETRRGSSLEVRVNECQTKCLLEPECRAYEVHKYSGNCAIKSGNMYDTPLIANDYYLFYNRDYECGRPPIRPDSRLVKSTGTTDGKNAIYKSMKDGEISTYECLPGGWRLKI